MFQLVSRRECFQLDVRQLHVLLSQLLLEVRHRLLIRFGRCRQPVGHDCDGNQSGDDDDRSGDDDDRSGDDDDYDLLNFKNYL